MIYIVGAGALGCLWASKLAPSEGVCFVAPLDTNHNDSGLLRATRTVNYQCLDDTKQNKQIQCPILSLPSTATLPPGCVLLSTKSFDALPALSAILPYLSPLTPIILFQNGLGSQQAILKQFDSLPIYAAVTTEGANMPDRNTLRHAGQGETFIGALNKPAHDHANTLIASTLFTHAMRTHYHDDIMAKLWTKLAINCAINPISAIENCLNGEVPATSLFQSSWSQLRQELLQLLNLQAISWNEQQLENAVFTVIENTASNLSSMLQDVRKGKRTEIDDISGYASQILAKHGKANTINHMLWRKVHALGD